MLATFPALFDFSLIGVLFLRITAGMFFFLFGLRLMHATHLVSTRGVGVRIIGYGYGTLKLAVGGLLLIGVYTQIAALFGVVLSIITFLQNNTSSSAVTGKQVQILLGVICFALLFLGPGIFAVDVPL